MCTVVPMMVGSDEFVTAGDPAGVVHAIGAGAS
jgi:hypothetical protein